MIFIDRWGREHKPDEQSIVKPRRGVFAAVVVDEKILITWPGCAPDVPELPGGGVDEGETLEQALIREIQEEAAVMLPHIKPAKRFDQEIGLYADDCSEFWHYTQTYFLLQDEAYKACLFDGERTPEDALKSRWVPLRDLGDISLHAVHRAALRRFLHDGA